MDHPVECAKCKQRVCRSTRPELGPTNCPTKTRGDIVEKAIREYEIPEIRELGRSIALQGYAGYVDLPEISTPLYMRVEEIMGLARRMGYSKIGIAACSGLLNEARLFTEILKNHNYKVASVSCEAGALSLEQVGINQDDTIIGSEYNNALPPCSGIAQALILNAEGTNFNVLMGLCVGQDYLFFKYSDVPGTVLIAKDRVLGHNPAAALYQSHAYYHRLLRKEEAVEKPHTP